jgi:hypothetical protein
MIPVEFRIVCAERNPHWSLIFRAMIRVRKRNRKEVFGGGAEWLLG